MSQREIQHSEFLMARWELEAVMSGNISARYEGAFSADCHPPVEGIIECIWNVVDM